MFPHNKGGHFASTSDTKTPLQWRHRSRETHSVDGLDLTRSHTQRQLQLANITTDTDADSPEQNNTSTWGWPRCAVERPLGMLSATPCMACSTCSRVFSRAFSCYQCQDQDPHSHWQQLAALTAPPGARGSWHVNNSTQTRQRWQQLLLTFNR